MIISTIGLIIAAIIGWKIANKILGPWPLPITRPTIKIRIKRNKIHK